MDFDQDARADASGFTKGSLPSELGEAGLEPGLGSGLLRPQRRMLLTHGNPVGDTTSDTMREGRRESAIGNLTLGSSGKALMLFLKRAENDARRDSWEAAFHSLEFFSFEISVETCRQIEGKKILQILNFHAFGNFIAFRQITQTVAVFVWIVFSCTW